MKRDRRLKALIGVLVTLAVIALIVMNNYLHPPRPAPNQSNYYAGPRINKARTLIVDDNGKVYGPAPPEMNAPPARPGGNPPENTEVHSGK
jgi:hypothetical protein